MKPTLSLGAQALRGEISARNLEQPRSPAYETTYGGSIPSVIYGPELDGPGHGNFVAASYRRIVKDATWRRRLAKTYTAESRIARRHDRKRGELECATSSDALLMNVFCYPGLLARAEVYGLLGLGAGARPEFGVRVHVPLRSGLRDRTEADMLLGDCLVEAKLTEAGFGAARPELVERYRDLDAVFAREELPRHGKLFLSYQLIRGVLAAFAREERFLLVCDGRRTDLMESWYRVACAVRSADVRSRLRVLTWQELAAVAPRVLRAFLSQKYGIEAR